MKNAKLEDRSRLTAAVIGSRSTLAELACRPKKENFQYFEVQEFSMIESNYQLAFSRLAAGIKNHPLVELIVWEFIAFLPMILSSFIISNEDLNYAALSKPAFAPPAWAFIAVWILNFSLSGAGAWLVSRSSASWNKKALAFSAFGALIVLNLVSSMIPLNAQNPRWNYAILFAIWLAATITGLANGRIDRRAGLALVPYVAWITFAAYLIYRIKQLN